MCDYSISASLSVVARGDEELEVYQFPSGSKGLAETRCIAASRAWKPTGFWNRIKHACGLATFIPPAVPAVCIPPGAKLCVSGFDAKQMANYCIGPSEDVEFMQVNVDQEKTHHDAIRFSNGKIMLLQYLNVGQRVEILSLEGVGNRAWVGDSRVNFPNLVSV